MPTVNGSNSPSTVSARYDGQGDANRLLTSYAGASKQMNLYRSGDDPGGPLAPAEWTMSITQEGMRERSYFVAALFRGKELVCRMALMGRQCNKADARRALALKARLWIADYLSRPHTGSTEFGPLISSRGAPVATNRAWSPTDWFWPGPPVPEAG